MSDRANEWLNTRQAYKHLGISPRELYRLVDEGVLQAYRDDGDLRIRLDDLDQLTIPPHG